MTIWKFPVEALDQQVIRAPAGWQPLCVQVQYDRPCLWALVDPDAAQVDHSVWIYRTGHDVAVEGKRYLSTFQLYAGSLVFHAFVEVQPG